MRPKQITAVPDRWVLQIKNVLGGWWSLRNTWSDNKSGALTAHSTLNHKFYPDYDKQFREGRVRCVQVYVKAEVGE